MYINFTFDLFAKSFSFLLLIIFQLFTNNCCYFIGQLAFSSP